MIIDIAKAFPGRPPITANLRYPVGQSTVLVLFGPSGSGKTTILRSIAGLEWPEHGRIQFLSQTWLDTAHGIRKAPQERNIGYMSQDYALFPPYTVAGNIAYGLGELGREERKKRVAAAVDLLQLQGLEDRKPRQLSGGQQQRVALARAVARQPQLLLLDEPLSALDAPTRALVRDDLRRLLTQLALPSIIVTHDWTEALIFGDLIAVMDAGSLLQIGPPQEVFSRPATASVAQIVGIETVVEGDVVESDHGLATVSVNGVMLKSLGEHRRGSAVYACIRAEDVLLEQVGSGLSSARNHLAGRVSEMVPQGILVKVTIDCGFPLTVVITRGASEELGLQPGSSVVAAIKAGAVHVVQRSA